jgi:hypothetical protein
MKNKPSRVHIIDKERGELDLFSFIMTWSVKFPFDRIWREKHGIPFNSKKHRKAKFIDIIIELSQDAAFDNLKVKKEYRPGTGNYLSKRERKITQQETEESFENLDINNLQYDENGNIIL